MYNHKMVLLYHWHCEICRGFVGKLLTAGLEALQYENSLLHLLYDIYWESNLHIRSWPWMRGVYIANERITWRCTSSWTGDIHQSETSNLRKVCALKIVLWNWLWGDDFSEESTGLWAAMHFYVLQSAFLKASVLRYHCTGFIFFKVFQIFRYSKGFKWKDIWYFNADSDQVFCVYKLN